MDLNSLSPEGPGNWVKLPMPRSLGDHPPGSLGTLRSDRGRGGGGEGERSSEKLRDPEGNPRPAVAAERATWGPQRWGWEDSGHQNGRWGRLEPRVWPASCWAVRLHLDMPRAPEGPPAPLPAPAASRTWPDAMSLPWDTSINKCRKASRWVRGGVPRAENDTLE